MSNSTDGITLSRTQLYSEIWKISAAGAAKKYGLTYSILLKCCKEHHIPVPPSGYRTRLAYNKPVVQPPLPDFGYDEIVITTSKSTKKEQEIALHDEITIVHEAEDDSKTKAVEAVLGKAKTQQSYGSKQNIYERDVLYQEVWTMPVSKVALKYGVSDVALHKKCKALNVPVPPRGYWAKLQAGQHVEKTPLPKKANAETAIGLRWDTEPAQASVVHIPASLSFLDADERKRVIDAAESVVPLGKGTRLDPKIAFYSKKVIDWNKSDVRQPGSEKSPKVYQNRREHPPFLAGVIGEETLPRVYRLLESLLRAIKPLGCSLTDDLCFIIRGETVSISVHEMQDVFPHIITKEENMQLLKYEERKKGHGWESKPNIRKYDYIFNGRLYFTVNGREFIDTESQDIEDQLGNIIIELYESSEREHKWRLAREEKIRKEQEESRRREELRRRRDNEMERVNALVNEANDYKTACAIRAYADAIEASAEEVSESTEKWLEWARAKADWFDPSMDTEDPLLGKRDHSADPPRRDSYSGWGNEDPGNNFFAWRNYFAKRNRY